MAGQLPSGDPAPLDGSLPSSVAFGSAERSFGVYIHVPFCRVRCGYCDFNTYTSEELRGARRADYADHACAEIALAGRVLHQAAVAERPAATVFFGGGTPTLLPADHLVRMLDAVRATWGLAADAEITVEANPDTVDAASLDTLRSAGVTRISLGMQSAVPQVLRTLDRTHTPARVGEAATLAKAAGLQLSIDLIYGTPGESLDDWQLSLETALSYDPDHLSAYALIVEDGTQLARQIDRGEVAAPDDDLTADKYELLDERMRLAGFDWYEISNWSRSQQTQSRHNLGYWTSQDWWGIGPGAHSHIGGLRWWNVKHPAAYADRLSAGHSPAAARETLNAQASALERTLLTSRLASGAELAALALEPNDRRKAVSELIADGLIDGPAALNGRAVLTLRGRLLADVVARRLS